MSYKLIVRPEAESELLEAVKWYEEKVKGLGANFLLNVEATIESIIRIRKHTHQPIKIRARLISSGSTSAAYSYDANGNVISDSHRGISFIIYSLDNLPVSVYMTSGQKLYYENDVYGRRTSTSDASSNIPSAQIFEPMTLC